MPEVLEGTVFRINEFDFVAQTMLIDKNYYLYCSFSSQSRTFSLLVNDTDLLFTKSKRTKG